MKGQTRNLFLITFSLILTGCNLLTEQKILTEEPSAIPEVAASPTPTSTLLTGSRATGGELEIRIPYDIFNPELELPAESPPTCITMIPFEIKEEGGHQVISGKGLIDCTYVDTPAGTPITYTITIRLDSEILGELLPATDSYPDGFLDAQLTLEGSLTQSYTDYPSEAINPCPSADPCVSPLADFIPLPFNYTEGSTIDIPWTFILHVK